LFDFVVDADSAAKRLDQFLAAHLPDISRARVQELIASENVLVNGAAAKPALRLRAGDRVEVTIEVRRAPLRAVAEDIPLDVVYEDEDLAVVNKPAGMMVHTGAGATDDTRNRGTLVNALLHRFGALSRTGGELRPGIVHRLDKDTSGLIIVAKHDAAHRRLAEQFSRREVHKRYIALVHDWPKQARGTIDTPISRDVVRRTRMTTRRREGRTAVTHYSVAQKIESAYGRFALLDIEIETGRTHQIRVHLASIGHPVVGDALYGAPREIVPPIAQKTGDEPLTLGRNFLHAAAIQFTHPVTRAALSLARPLPPELENFLARLAAAHAPERGARRPRQK
jgi:23S rRNA pseudouridine1911/1915/1917 synthase